MTTEHIGRDHYPGGIPVSLTAAIERLRCALKMHKEHRTTLQSLSSSVDVFLQDYANIAAGQPKPAGAVPLVDASFEAFNEITGLCSNLREGGPVPEDLEGLSSGLESAIDIAANMLAKISDSRSAPTPQQPAAEGAAVIQQMTTQAEGASREAVAWMHDDGDRVIHARTKAVALRDGGASASSVAAYSVPLYTRPTPAADVGGVTVTDEAVNRAYQAFHSGRHANTFEAWRAALTAALTPEARHGE